MTSSESEQLGEGHIAAHAEETIASLADQLVIANAALRATRVEVRLLRARDLELRRTLESRTWRISARVRDAVAVFLGPLAARVLGPEAHREPISGLDSDQALALLARQEAEAGIPIVQGEPAQLTPSPDDEAGRAVSEFRVSTPTEFVSPSEAEPPRWLAGVDEACARLDSVLVPEMLPAMEVALCSVDDGTSAYLESRMDGLDDLLGRRLAAAWSLVELAQRHSNSSALGDKVAFDARCIQDPAYSLRGVGRFAHDALAGLADAVPPDRLLLLTRSSHPQLPPEVARLGTVVSTLRGRESECTLFVQPSPMTASVAPYLGVLQGGTVCVAVVYDFIPAAFPSRYLPEPEQRLDYKAALVALSQYDELICISHSTLDDLATVGIEGRRVTVAWPDSVMAEAAEASEASVATESTRVTIVIPSGGDARKNLPGALAACALLQLSGENEVSVVVLGHSHARAEGLGLSARMGLNMSRVVVADHLTDNAMRGHLADASVAIVPSFAEGLSLPVIESIRTGTPVVASRIRPHIELIGEGPWLADPLDPIDMARALRHVIGDRTGTLVSQSSSLARHAHESLRHSLAQQARNVTHHSAPREAPQVSRGARPSLGVSSPMPPQQSGISDYSAWTLGALSRFTDLTVYSTAREGVSAHGLRVLPLSDDPRTVRRHDSFLHVLGDSHFHVPQLRMLSELGGAALAHDTRMVELYLHLRGVAGVTRLMRSGAFGHDVTEEQVLHQVHHLDELVDRGYSEIAQDAQPLVLHSRSAVGRIVAETGVEARWLPMVPYRLPEQSTLTRSDRQSARHRLGIESGTFAIGIHGGVDIRTKHADTIIEALGWLRTWGVDARVYFVGGCPEQRVLEGWAARAKVLDRVHFVGRVTEEVYRDYLLGVDVGLQVRTSRVLTMSGAVLDCFAFGVPVVASASILSEVEAPAYAHAAPDVLSPLLLAEALMGARDAGVTPTQIERERAEYVAVNSPESYARRLLALLGIGGV